MGSGKRFLRARAGSPTTWSSRDRRRKVPPRTRGFTVRTSDRERRPLGSSAHARVHRPFSGAFQRLVRFLRARAGSPTICHAHSSVIRVPPRTRGFTDMFDFRATLSKGSSAHARVHRDAGFADARASRFLRARAGSPSASWAVKRRSAVPPRTRGFTAVAVDLRVAEEGSSAHARVHRVRQQVDRRVGWFLRARAGSPWINALEEVVYGVPPRTRGFTAHLAGLCGRSPGSSAHARVHRPCCRPGAGQGRFLRARAGSPNPDAPARKRELVPPRTRGFTGRGHASRAQHQGSSAHARVHRPGSVRHLDTARFLRARAGSPTTQSVAYSDLVVPPRTRGFTGPCRPAALSDDGSSAHARVHPWRSDRIFWPMRFLRARAGSPGQRGQYSLWI